MAVEVYTSKGVWVGDAVKNARSDERGSIWAGCDIHIRCKGGSYCWI